MGFGMKALADAAQKRRPGGGSGDDHSESLSTRLAAMEQRLAGLERNCSGATPANTTPAVNDQIAAAEARLQRACEAISERAERRFRDALTDESILASVVERAVESTLHDRIERIEATVASQSTELQQLREYSLNSERNIQRLLVGIDRLVANQSQGPSAETNRKENVGRRTSASSVLA